MIETTSRETIYTHSKNQNLPLFLLTTLKELKHYRYAYFSFVSNTLSNRYRHSVLGFFWTLISPLLNLAIMVIIFSLVFKQNPRFFGIYVFSALSPWGFISSCLLQSPLVFINAENYIKKVHIPKFLFPLSLVSVEGLNFLFSMVSIYIIFLFLGAPLSWIMLLTPLAMIIVFVFALGLCIILSVAHVYFRDVFHITSVIVGALMFTIPIMYPVSAVPTQYQFIFTCNPFYYFINLFRIILYDIRIPAWQEWLIPLGIALCSFLLGSFILMKNDADIIFRL